MNNNTVTLGRLISDSSGKVFEGWFKTLEDGKKYHKLTNNWYSLVEEEIPVGKITKEMIKFVPELKALTAGKPRRQYDPSSYTTIGDTDAIDLSSLKGWSQVEHVVVVPKKGDAERALRRGDTVSVVYFGLDSVERIPMGAEVRRFKNQKGNEPNFLYKGVAGSHRLLDYEKVAERYPHFIPEPNQGVGGVYISGDTLVLCGHGTNLKELFPQFVEHGFAAVCGPTNNNAGDNGKRFGGI